VFALSGCIGGVVRILELELRVQQRTTSITASMLRELLIVCVVVEKRRLRVALFGQASPVAQTQVGGARRKATLQQTGRVDSHVSKASVCT
jgi:hypothetical protein